MPTRDERRTAAAKNLALMRGAFAGDTAKTIENAKIYEDGEGRELELPEVEEGAVTTTSVTSDFAVKALHAAHGKVVLVDPCSFTRPGGAYEDGAFGAGPQGFDAEVVIELFRAWIAAHPGAIGHITFAVPRAAFGAFDDAFGEVREAAPQPAEAAADTPAQDDEDEFDPNDLPEGVTFRS